VREGSGIFAAPDRDFAAKDVGNVFRPLDCDQMDEGKKDDVDTLVDVVLNQLCIYRNTISFYYPMCRFRTSRPLFLCIMHAVQNHDDYFIQKRNTTNVLGLSCLC
jgi:hypothetical protein